MHSPLGEVSPRFSEITMEKKEVTRPDWMELLETILTKPGLLGDYYSAFHNYSVGNQIIAVLQLLERGVPIGPIASFNAWKKKGRSVMKGQKAIGLWMPITVNGKGKSKDDDDEPTPPGMPRRIFVMRNNWFSLAQTQPDPRAAEQGESSGAVEEQAEPEIQWDQSLALRNLSVTMEPFEKVNGNVQGYAYSSERRVAVSPIAAFPHKTLFHELAHCELHGDVVEGFVCEDDLTQAVKEVEAESVAFICCASLNLPGLDYSRGYVQHWLAHAGSRDVLKKSAGRIFSAADRILKAGFAQPEKVAAEPEAANA
ncbi:hypothetical protein C8C96_4853 [Acidovorax sp. 100]|jgi:hypothetical protein|nr:hypothetical protein C8C96_4853 [Acidovorax sp. 100]